MTELDMTHQRSTDRVPPTIKISRDVPLVWLLSMGLGLIVTIAQNWIGQEKTADAVARLTTTVVEQTKQIQALSVEIGVKNLKDVEHDLKLADHERRIGNIEQVRK